MRVFNAKVARQSSIKCFMAVVLAVGASNSLADVFGTVGDQFGIEFITVGDPGNFPDVNGRPNPVGSVDQVYRIGKHEISEHAIDVANRVGGLGITHDNRGGPFAATSVSWIEAARFINWLNVSTNSHPAYKIDGDERLDLWTPGDDGYDPDNLYRNSLARYFLPSVDEWYKAAYFEAETETYHRFPNGSDDFPDGINFIGDGDFEAVWQNGGNNGGPNHITNVGVASPYGTVGQAGNVWEIEESDYDLLNDNTGLHQRLHGKRGGGWAGGPDSFDKIFRFNIFEDQELTDVGFRVASSQFAAGDLDQSGAVTGLDFLEWQRGFGMLYDALDLAVWRANYGVRNTNLNGNFLAIPEPSAIVLLCLSVVIIALHR